MEVTEELLVELYVVQKKSAPCIAKILNKCSTTIYNKLEKFQIPRRDSVSCQHPIDFPKEKLAELYLEKRFSAKKVGEILGASDEVIRLLLHKYDIKVRDKVGFLIESSIGRKMSLAQKKKLSKIRITYYKEHEHWNTNNATPTSTRKKISTTLLQGRKPAPSYYGASWRFSRTSCLQRDSYTCQACGGTTELQVHHWTPYRFCFDNSLDNLVTLCRGCHQDLHKDYKKEGFIEEAEGEFYA